MAQSVDLAEVDLDIPGELRRPFSKRIDGVGCYPAAEFGDTHCRWRLPVKDPEDPPEQLQGQTCSVRFDPS